MKRIVYLLLICIAINSCEKDKVEIDPAEAILGTWQKTEIGNWPDMDTIPESTIYREYMPDSIMIEYNTESGKSYSQKYSIDSLLYEYASIPNGPPLIFKYKYQFLDNNNKLRLDVFEDPAMFSTLIFKRIN
jgi:hypothetical protein